jgi:hypothetical protein
VARRSLALAFAAAVLLAATSACRASDTGVSSSGSSSTTVLTSYASIDELQRSLEANGISCTLEYEGLRQDDRVLSLCVIDGEQATLTIWDRPEVLEKFTQSTSSAGSGLGAAGAVAVGRNWSIDLDTEATATRVASALGGRVKA